MEKRSFDKSCEFATDTALLATGQAIDQSVRSDIGPVLLWAFCKGPALKVQLAARSNKCASHAFDL